MKSISSTNRNTHRRFDFFSWNQLIQIWAKAPLVSELFIGNKVGLMKRCIIPADGAISIDIGRTWSARLRIEGAGRHFLFLLAFQWENLFSFKCSIIPPFSSWKRRRIREFRSSFYSSLRKMIQWIRSSGPSERSDAFFKKKLKQSMTSFHNQSHDVNRRTFWVFINISGWTLLFDSTDFI